MGHWHVGHNMPGYLPESDVMCFDDLDSAIAFWHGDVHQAADTLEDDGEFLEIDTNQNLMGRSDVEQNGGLSIMVENSRYWLIEAEDGSETCELSVE